MSIFQFAQAVVAEGDAKDVRSEILEGLLAGTDGLGVNHPIFAPEGRGDLSKEDGLFQCVPQLGAEDSGECFDGDEKVRAGRAPAAVSSEATALDLQRLFVTPDPIASAWGVSVLAYRPASQIETETPQAEAIGYL